MDLLGYKGYRDMTSVTQAETDECMRSGVWIEFTYPDCGWLADMRVPHDGAPRRPVPVARGRMVMEAMKHKPAPVGYEAYDSVPSIICMHDQIVAYMAKWETPPLPRFFEALAVYG